MPISGSVKTTAIKATLAVMPEVVRDAMGDAIRTTASEVVRQAQDAVPVRHGFLKDHIAFSFSPSTCRAKVGITLGSVTIRGVKIRRLIVNPKTGELGGGSATEAREVRPTHYAHLVEYGHGGPHGAPAHPFLGPAFRAQLGPLDSRMRAAQRKSLADVAAIGARYL